MCVWPALQTQLKKKGNIRPEDGGETRRSQSFGLAVYFCLLNVAALAGRSNYRFTGEWEARMAGWRRRWAD